LEPELLTRLDAFVRPALRVIERTQPRRLAGVYVRGLLGPAPRKNVEQIARQARGVASAPAFERDVREMLSEEDWRHGAMMWEGAARLLDRTAGWQGYTLDDTALLKQGEHSVGVANQYAGCVGGLANCQVLVTLGLAQEHASTPLAHELFLPAAWDRDDARRADCHVPRTVRHRPKWQLAIEHLEQAEWMGLPRLPVLADSGYGENAEFRRWLDAHGWSYVVGVSVRTAAWPAGLTFRPRSSPPSRGRQAFRLEPERPCNPQLLSAFAANLPAQAWQSVCWRDGSRGAQRGRFAALRVRPSRGWNTGGIRSEDLQEECWLLVHWPAGEKAPTKLWLSNLPASTPLETLIGLTRLRWRIERDYREGKGLAGLDHCEGRTWPGLHHHAALVTLAQQFLAVERLAALGDAERAHAPPTEPAVAPSSLPNPSGLSSPPLAAFSP
jgi:SRSO17 transposase